MCKVSPLAPHPNPNHPTPTPTPNSTQVHVSLCQINKSVEVDYYKLRCNGAYRIIIPRNFSKVGIGVGLG